MILDHTQYRFFKKDNCSDIFQRFMKMVPLATNMKSNSKHWDGHGSDDDQELFCHEIAHCMDLTSKGKEHLLLLDNFGWARITRGKWTARMAENEYRVFSYQWMLQKELGYSSHVGLLTPTNVPTFLQHMTNRELSEDHFQRMHNSVGEEIKPTFYETLNRTINYIVAAVDNERSKS